MKEKLLNLRGIRFALAVSLLFLGQTVMAQSTVTGTVSASNGQPIPGVNVMIKGTTKGVSTDVKGTYKISATPQTTLLFTGLGYTEQQILVGAKTTIDVVLTESSQIIEDVVVVGYTPMKRRDLTGAVGSVNSDILATQAQTSAALSLRGQVAGMSVTQSTGQAGADPVIEIRGMSTIDKSTEPLIVIDGVFGNMSDFSAMNPNDIEKVDVLKDASSTAIYGARGSNGVVIITTKSGTKGGNKVSYAGNFGVRQTVRMPDMLNAQQFVNMWDDANKYFGYTGQRISEAERAFVEGGGSTNWPDLLSTNGTQTSHTVTLSGGNDRENHYISAGYTNEAGSVKPEGFERYSLNVKVNGKVGKMIEVGGTMNGSFTTYTAGGGAEAIRSAYRLRPTGQPYDENGNLSFWMNMEDAQIPNVLFERDNNKNERQRVNAYGSLYAQLTPIKGLIIKSSFMPKLTFEREGNWSGTWNKQNVGTKPPTAYAVNKNRVEYTWDNTINYSKTFANDHVIGATGLFSVYQDVNEMYRADVNGLPFESLWRNFKSADMITNAESSYTKQAMLSYMLRLNYTYKDKYLLTITGRTDGSSKLAKGNKWQFFPSAAIAWRASEEKFIKDLNVFDNLKLRFSYGTSGNNSVNPYGSLSTLYSVSYDFDGTPASGTAPTLPNASLCWEKSDEYNLGLDMGFLKNKLNVSVELYDKNTNDLILKRKLPIHTGYDNVNANVGKVNNKGLEVTINSVNIQRADFVWDMSINFSTNKNKIVSLYGDDEDDIANSLFIGQPVKVNYWYKFDGIWKDGEAFHDKAKAGHPKVIDLNGDNKISPVEDKMVLGSPFPKWIGGITNNFRYKNVDLSVFVYTRQGEQKYSDFHDKHSNDFNMRYNLSAEVYGNYWTPDNNENATWWSPGTQGNGDWRKAKFYQDCSFVRIGNITLGYEFGEKILKKIGLSRLRVYATAINPFTFSDYTGFDPEWAETSVIKSGYSSSTYMFGLNIGF